MKWPELVPDSACNTPITVSITDGVGEDGIPKVVAIWSGNCNYSEKQRQILDAERRLITLGAAALFNGDIFPGREKLEGSVAVNGGALVWQIYRGSRARNPDGTVNFTQLELM
ncbi:MAG TPA: hypothetical protein VHO71_04955 [Caproiciproducens sp.]|nr:hypothetical protein [Caproiciproducens sp.]